jgi:hypothetical protein
MPPVPHSDALSLVEALAALHLKEIRSEAMALMVSGGVLACFGCWLFS